MASSALTERVSLPDSVRASFHTLHTVRHLSCQVRRFVANAYSGAWQTQVVWGVIYSRTQARAPRVNRASDDNIVARPFERAALCALSALLLITAA